jgi:GTP-binding protein
MKIKSTEFIVSAPDLKSCPDTNFPEFAFIGRSNVGKSSLINLLTGKRELAKVSDAPGKTVLLNYFKINGSWFLVDLPGYGYAKVAKAKREDFNEAVNHYIEARENLTCLFVLIDSRLPPQLIDLQFIEWVETLEVPFALIFTKTDKQNQTLTQQSIAAFNAALAKRGAQPPPTFTSSIKTQEGRSEILASIERMCAVV